jgi:hypothetical protein
MAVPVVDPLEVVDIQQQDRRGHPGPPGPAHPAVCFPLPGDGVEQAGLGIRPGRRAP